MIQYKQKNTAFTLIELLVVMVIIGVLATVSVATFGGNKEKARIAKETANCVQRQKCEQATTICEENGGINCDSFCEGDTLDCDDDMYTAYLAQQGGGETVEAYPDSSEWTPDSCFVLSSGAIRGTFGSRYNIAGVCTADVIIPEQIGGEVVTIIDTGAFKNSGIDSIRIPDTVTHINRDAFDGANITEIILPSSLESIGESGLRNTDLTSITLPNSVTSLGSYAFTGTPLESITIGTGIPSIGTWALAYTGLTDLYIPDNVTSLHSQAFVGTPLSGISLPSHLDRESIFTNVGPGCTKTNDCITVR